MDKFDSSSGRAQCWATYTTPGGQSSVIRDHSFRVESGPDHPDPMFGRFGWPRQAYSADPDGLAASVRPTDVVSAQWVKKRWGEQQEMHLYGVEVAMPTNQVRPKDAENGPVAGRLSVCQRVASR
jgi:hypothetical protein